MSTKIKMPRLSVSKGAVRTMSGPCQAVCRYNKIAEAVGRIFNLSVC